MSATRVAPTSTGVPVGAGSVGVDRVVTQVTIAAVATSAANPRRAERVMAPGSGEEGAQPGEEVGFFFVEGVVAAAFEDGELGVGHQ